MENNQASPIPLTDEEREGMVDEHPVVTKQYDIVTPMIERAYKLVRDRVWMRRTGTVMYGSPQTGKTRCSMAIAAFVKGEFPNIYTTTFSADVRGTGSYASLPADILREDGVILSKRLSYKERLFQLLVHIDASLGPRAGRQFVLIVDEMQMLSKDDFNVLLVIHNRLYRRGIAMTTIGFAQPEILHRRSSFLATDDRQLIARFLCEPISFDGCGSAEDLTNILKTYDETNRYPRGSDWTYTRFFLPRAYERNFRLTDSSKRIWGALKRAAQPTKSSSIPMLHLTGTVEHLLVANRKKDDPHFEITNEMLENAVTASGIYGFADALGSAPS